MKLIIYRPLENLNKHKSEKKSRSFIYHAKPQNSSIGGKKKKREFLVYSKTIGSLCALSLRLLGQSRSKMSKKQKKGKYFTSSSLMNRKQKLAVQLLQKKMSRKKQLFSNSKHSFSRKFLSVEYFYFIYLFFKSMVAENNVENKIYRSW